MTCLQIDCQDQQQIKNTTSIKRVFNFGNEKNSEREIKVANSQENRCTLHITNAIRLEDPTYKQPKKDKPNTIGTTESNAGMAVCETLSRSFLLLCQQSTKVD
jgi:hypothetical protein